MNKNKLNKNYNCLYQIGNEHGISCSSVYKQLPIPTNEQCSVLLARSRYCYKHKRKYGSPCHVLLDKQLADDIAKNCADASVNPEHTITNNNGSLRLGQNDSTTHLCYVTTENSRKAYVIVGCRKTVQRNCEHCGIDLPCLRRHAPLFCSDVLWYLCPMAVISFFLSPPHHQSIIYVS